MERVGSLPINKIFDIRVTPEGLVVTGPMGRKKVEIVGAKLSETAADSFAEGVLKGVGVALTNVTYPLFAAAFKAGEGYIKAKKAAEEVGLDKGEVTMTGLKGALVGGLRGLSHGIMDAVSIGLLASLGLIPGAIVGSFSLKVIGFLVASVLMGGLYNLFKDDYIINTDDRSVYFG